MFNIIKLKLIDINLSIFCSRNRFLKRFFTEMAEIVTYEKEFHY